MSHRVRRQVGLEVCADTARVAVRPGHLAPDGTQLGLLTARASSYGGPLLCTVHKHATLAGIEERIFAALGTLELKLW